MAKGWALSTGNLPRGGLPRNSVDRITDRPDMTSAVDRGRIALTQQQQKCSQIQDFCWQMSQFMTKQTETIILGHQTFRMHVFNDRGLTWMSNVSHTYCCNGPAALVLSAVVIRGICRMIVKTLFVCFLFSENLSK